MRPCAHPLRYAAKQELVPNISSEGGGGTRKPVSSRGVALPPPHISFNKESSRRKTAAAGGPSRRETSNRRRAPLLSGCGCTKHQPAQPQLPAAALPPPRWPPPCSTSLAIHARASPHTASADGGKRRGGRRLLLMPLLLDSLLALGASLLETPPGLEQQRHRGRQGRRQSAALSLSAPTWVWVSPAVCGKRFSNSCSVGIIGQEASMALQGQRMTDAHKSGKTLAS